MQRDALLTQDELDFIQTMQHNPQLNVRDATSSLLVNGGSQIRDLLTRQQMTFPLHLVEDEFHALHLRLGVPSIYEDGPMVRPWRLTLEEPVALENAKGQPGTLWVHEVSHKGVLLEVRNKTKPPKHFALWFSPSGYERISLRGNFERETENGFYAYELSQTDTDETERLRQFILQQHRLTHPALHT
jgi:hypothetical protein